MLKKGSMIYVKKGLGIAMLIMGAGFVFNIDWIKQCIMDCNIFSIGIMIAAGFFLLRSGKRR